MKTLLIGFATLPFLAGVAMAGQSTVLSDVQMDQVTAGDIVIPPLVVPPTTITFSPITITLPNGNNITTPGKVVTVPGIHDSGICDNMSNVLSVMVAMTGPTKAVTHNCVPLSG